MRVVDSWPDDFWPDGSKRTIEEGLTALLNDSVQWNDLLDVLVVNRELLQTLSSRSKRSPRFAEEHGAVFKDTLRRLVDDWIHSGHREGGTDDPWARVPPVDEMDDFYSDNPPHISLGEDGRREARFPYYRQLDNPTAWARNLAFSYFANLLDSVERERLSRCLECGAYFVRERRPVKGAIKLGSWCRQHRDQRKTRSLNATRSRRTTLLIQLAAQLSLQYEREEPREIWSKWIAHKINTEIRKHPKQYERNAPLTRRWVTENKVAIAAEVKKTSARKIANALHSTEGKR